MNKLTHFVATCPKNLEGLLESELISLGAQTTKQTVAGVKFTGDLTIAYRACLWSRLANRVLLPLAEFTVESAADLYEGVRRINWLEHLNPKDSFVIDFSGLSSVINNSHFGALKVKDAIVDQIRERAGTRPDINKDSPDLRINVRLAQDMATVSIDLSGESLHKRGYRTTPVTAPLKENLAAAILLRCNWPKFAAENRPLFDPMCGSGTILVEAAMMAQDYAPGLGRQSFGFTKWRNHQPEIWKRLVREAEERRKEGVKKYCGTIYGCDADPTVIETATQHIKKASLEQVVKVAVGKVEDFKMSKTPLSPGIVITNPPYGNRLHEVESLTGLYTAFGAMLRHHFLNWEAAMFTGNPELGKTMGIRSYKQYNFFNGTIPCKLLLFHVIEPMFWREYKGEG